MGVQHVAIEVLNAGFARAGLAAREVPLLTEVVVDEHGMEQFFTVQDTSSGVQLGFVSRTGHRVGFQRRQRAARCSTPSPTIDAGFLRHRLRPPPHYPVGSTTHDCVGQPELTVCTAPFVPSCAGNNPHE